MLTYKQRADLCINSVAKQLFTIMEEKQTNLCIAADVTTKSQLIKIAEDLGPEICLLKTHIDIVEDFDTELIIELQRLSEQHNFLFFEDRKFADIGNTVVHQYQDGIYHIADWAHIVNAHTIPGPGIIKGLRQIGLNKNRGLLMLAEMTPEGNLATGEYTNETIKMSKEYEDFVIGFISTKKLTDDPKYLHITPGVKLAEGGDDLMQQYNTPEKVIKEKGNDIIVVGRGIYQADDPLAEAKKYHEAGWQAYLSRLSL